MFKKMTMWPLTTQGTYVYDHLLGVQLAIDSKIFADKHTFNNTFASAVQLMPEFVEQTFSKMKFGHATNLLDSKKCPFGAARINKQF